MDCSAEIEGDGACRARGVREWVIKMCSCYSCTFVCMLFFLLEVFIRLFFFCALNASLCCKNILLHKWEAMKHRMNCEIAVWTVFFFFQFRTNQGRSQRVALRAREPPHHPKFFGARSCVERRRRWRCNRWTWKKNRWKGENNTEAGMRFEPRPSAWQSSILLQSHAGFCFLYWPFWLITNTKEKYIHNKTIGWKKISLES